MSAKKHLFTMKDLLRITNDISRDLEPKEVKEAWEIIWKLFQETTAVMGTGEYGDYTSDLIEQELEAEVKRIAAILKTIGKLALSLIDDVIIALLSV